MSCGTPISKSRLLNTDIRFPLLFQGSEDRTKSEKRQGGIEYSRGSFNNYFISDDKRCLKLYNDQRYTINNRVRKHMWRENKKKNLGLDKRLINHFSYVLIRDCLGLYEDDFEEEKLKISTGIFEAINSSNWNTMRFKPPPSYESQIGWRVEVRSIDSQLTPEQNFCLEHAILILQRLVTCQKMNVNFYIPMSLVKPFSHLFRSTKI